MQQLDNGLWLWTGPSDHAGKKHFFRTAITDVILPEARKVRQAWIDRYQQAGVAPLPSPKIVLVLDGETVALKCLMSVLSAGLADKTIGDDIIALKLPSSTTGSTQPADVSPIFKVIKRMWKTYKARGDTIDYTPDCLKIIEAILERSKIAEASRVLYYNCLKLLPLLVARAFTVTNIQRGWAVAGLWPFDAGVILNQCRTFENYSLEERAAIKAAVPKVAEHMKKFGQVTDAQMRDAVGQAVTLPGPRIDKRGKTVRPLEELCVSRRRAVLLTTEVVVNRAAYVDAALANGDLEDDEPKQVCTIRLFELT